MGARNGVSQTAHEADLLKAHAAEACLRFDPGLLRVHIIIVSVNRSKRTITHRPIRRIIGC